jgi:hypothetical protein
MTKTSWKQFLFWQLPGAALVLTLAVQVLAFSVSDVPIWRARWDEVALATLRDPAEFRVLLFGDSITSMATGRFSLGGAGEVGNISTNAAVGLPGTLFQLQRYLSAHSSPEHVVLTYTPSVYSSRKTVRTAHYNLWHVYNLPEEHEFLRAYFPGIDQRDWWPAIFDVQERVVEPAFSYLVERKRSPRMDVGLLTANPDAPAGAALRADTLDVAVFREMHYTAMTEVGAEVLRRVCSLSKQYGFRIEVAWPPVPAQLDSLQRSSGEVTKLEAKIRSIMEGHCDFAGFTDFNKIRHYPNQAFRNDLIHLFDYGWEQRYSADMIKYAHGLLYPARRETPAPATVGANAIETTGIGRSLPERP